MSFRSSLIGAVATAAALVTAPADKAAATAIPPDCAGVASLGDWLTVGACLSGDKIFSIDAAGTEAGAGMPVAFSTDLTGDVHFVTFSPDSFRPSVVAYSVTVIDSDREIARIALEVEGPERLASKEIRAAFDGDVIATLSGAGVGLDIVGDTFHITDRFVMESATVLTSVTNVFVQRDRDVPVPATALLFGAGLLALTGLRRRTR